MHLYPHRYIVSGGKLLHKFDSALIKEQLDKCVPENMRLMIVAKSFVNTAKSKERWYGTMFADEKIEDKRLQRWNLALKSKHEKLSLPDPNEFIATDFNLVHPRVEPVPSKRRLSIEGPVKIRDDDLSRVWYKVRIPTY